MDQVTIGARFVVDEEGLQAMIDALIMAGHQVIGPRIVDRAIVLEAIDAVDDLPLGWRDEQQPGGYRLREGEDHVAFDCTCGPHSWKRYLYPAEEVLWQARRRDSGFEVEEPVGETPRYAFLGVRACDLSAIGSLDKVLADQPHPDPGYVARRSTALVIAVNCVRAGATCFCASMGTGPSVERGFDLLLTPVSGSTGIGFVVEAGSERGRAILSRIEGREATAAEVAEARASVDAAARSMGRQMVADVAEVLKRNLDHHRWSEVAERCLACGNCTMVCPTCFCASVDDVTDLAGETAGRTRHWDSCFTIDFSYIHGGSIRQGTAARYRQWMTHKLSSWHEQFGTSGCVGCGRCITWCPVGIDITEEARAISESERG